MTYNWLKKLLKAFIFIFFVNISEDILKFIFI